MMTRITMMLVLAAACAANSGCACMTGCGSNCSSCNFGCDSCPSCGLPEASCCCPDTCASCGCPEASCCCPDDCCDVASCGCPEASCCCPEASCCCPDASCGCPTDSCDTCTTSVGCGSPVVGQCRLIQRICNALHGRSNYCNGCSSDAYWSEWHNDPPSACPSCSPHASAGGRGQQYSSAARRRSQLSKRGVNFGDELRFAEQGSGNRRR